MTNSGREFLAASELEMPQLKESLTNMNGQNARFLELVSTILYFDHKSKAEVREKIWTLKSKQRYTGEEIEEAYEYIEILKKTASPR